ncbi:hypothetical protein ACX27_04280 [Nostoc piscinale CENA21]|uniref:Uncharacterized protein n=1 Tax=Nostoc piscinale CENA21 TaxID=224013 RepID=A0A0M4SUY1_9NOSO|nr:hypothetical protein [Nostoc piscinale]ALF52246.1 hypothetical protein ACX27_04280 [Nostoc piscinale CENA21]
MNVIETQKRILAVQQNIELQKVNSEILDCKKLLLQEHYVPEYYQHRLSLLEQEKLDLLEHHKTQFLVLNTQAFL